MGIAKDFSNLESILPKGVVKLLECPWTIILAIDHAKKVLSWYENLTEDKRPPREIWKDDRKLKRWFDDVFGDKGKKNYDQYIQVDQ